MPIPSSSHLKYNHNYSGSLTPIKPKFPSKFCRPRNLKLTYRGSAASASASEPTLSSSSAPAAVKERGIWVTQSGHFSVADSQLNSSGFELHRTTDNLDLDQLNALFAKVGFVRREKEKLRRSLHNTPSVIWLEYKKSGKVVAFARATGDDVYNAVIWDVVVDPSFQRPLGFIADPDGIKAMRSNMCSHYPCNRLLCFPFLSY
ncbi:hypothetical protein SUGI_0192080 [Cryptomeria japonica]|nr:hypothetical protein SUGI_0192080 [Cryptomeria japonica]